MTKINKVENQPNFPQLEDKINNFWKEKKIFQKSVDQRSIEDSYSFVDGPPFVSGMPHYGHLLTSIAKDVVPRYFTMKGKRVRRVWGWDCHGLPIEEKVNKKFGIKSSAQLEEEMGVERYVKECRNWVESCSDEWGWYIDKIGRWVDLENAYYTMHPEFMESVIWGFKQIYEKGLVYKGKRVSLFSTDTSTPVSNFEVAMDQDNYRDTEDLSIFVKFKLQTSDFNTKTNGQPTYIVAWTTTPWTIPSNFALGVNPNVDYVLVEFEGQSLIVAKSRLEYTFQTTAEHIGSEPGKLVRIIDEFKGTTLEGLKYEPIYDFFVDQKTENDFKVYLYDGVTIEDGTGVLHIAPAFGEEDFNLGQKFGLSAHQDIDEAGKMTVGQWKGTYLRSACESITEDLQQKGNLLRSQVYTHRLPYYRGENPLIYVAQDSYFINVQKVKSKMLELNQDINWIPDFIKEGRFAQTIETSPDWAISRNRYWATVMPIWRSEDGDEIVVGSFEEMMQYTGQIVKSADKDGIKYYFIKDEQKYNELHEEYGYAEETLPGFYDAHQLMDLHRDVCDKIVLKKDGKEYHRIPEVLDCWMDSGSVPHAEHHYPFENKDAFEQAYPADFIVEYVGQVRAWFNVLLRISTMLFADSANPKLANKPTFKNVICTGVLAGNDGRKMSKSYGNYPDPKEVLEKVGGEAVRLYLMGSPIMVGGDANWSDELLSEQVKNIMIPIWNTYKYLSIYAELHDWTPEHTNFTSENILDKWLESYINKVTADYAKALESYNIPESVKLIQPTIDNISAWWIRRSRDRFASGDTAALQTLYATLVQFIKTFAPQMPFLTEEIYQNLVAGLGIKDGKESVHLEDYPTNSDVDEALLSEMNLVRKVCSLGQSIRVTNALKVRQPLAKAFVTLVESELSSENEGMKGMLSNLQPSGTNNLTVRESLLDVIKDELNVKAVDIVGAKYEAQDGFIANTEGDLTVALDTRITEELKEEGLVAELKRQIQNFRKTSGLKMGEEINLQFTINNQQLTKIVEKYKEEIKSAVSAKEISFVDQLENGTKVKVDDSEIILGFEK
jgi:isoleucyl-tRNA synthetase